MLIALPAAAGVAGIISMTTDVFGLFKADSPAAQQTTVTVSGTNSGAVIGIAHSKVAKHHAPLYS